MAYLLRGIVAREKNEQMLKWNGGVQSEVERLPNKMEWGMVRSVEALLKFYHFKFIIILYVTLTENRKSLYHRSCGCRHVAKIP